RLRRRQVGDQKRRRADGRSQGQIESQPIFEPGADNPHFPSRKRLMVLIPLTVQASSHKTTAHLGASGAFRRACARSPVFWAPERVWRQGKRVSVSGAAKNLVAECVRSFQWKDGQNYA